MKIIKVIHAGSDEEIIKEKASFSINSYDVEEFIEAEINAAKKNSSVAVGLPLLLIPVVGQVAFAGFLRSHYKNENVKAPIKQICENLVKDLKGKLEQYEVINLEIAKEKYPRSQNLSVGTYALHPYDGKRLTRLENYHKNLALEKDDELIVLLGKMGARTVKIIEVNTDEQSASGKIGVNKVVIDVKGEAGFSQKLESSKELVVAFQGNNTEIDSNLLKSSLWFENDSKLNAIFESRRFAPNKIESYTLINTYTETFDFDFDLAVRYLVVKTDLKAEYNKLSKKERLFHVDFSN